MAVAALAPAAATLAAWREHWALAQALWAGGAVVVAAFVVRRVLSASGRQRVPGVFVWVLVAFFAGAAGAALVAAAAVMGPSAQPELWLLGRGWLLQGFVTALVVGVGGTMIPTLTRGEAVPGAAPGRRAHLAAALLFLASFPVEVYLAPAWPRCAPWWQVGSSSR
jgi:uncharacterized protein involved in response to NO